MELREKGRRGVSLEDVLVVDSHGHLGNEANFSVPLVSAEAILDTMDRIAKLAPKYLLPTHGLPFAFDPSVSAEGRAAAEHLLEGRCAGILAHTHRAALRSTEETPRALSF